MGNNPDNMSDEEFVDYMNSLPADVEEITVDNTEEGEVEEDTTVVEETTGIDTTGEEEVVVDELDEASEQSEVDPEDLSETDSDIDAEEATEDVDLEEDPENPEEAATSADEDGEEGQSEADEGTKEESTEETPRTHKIRANNMDFEFSDEEVKVLASKGMDYTKKMQEIAKHRKRISALEDEGISDSDFNMMIDVLKGDKDAMASVLKRTGIDALDLDTEEVTYAPTNYGRDEAQLAIDDVVNSISGDQEYNITHHVISNQWDEASRELLASKPQLISGLHDDIKSGNYDKYAPAAMKAKVLDQSRGFTVKSDVEYAIEAATNYAQYEDRVAADNLAAQESAEATRVAVAAAKTAKAKQKTLKTAASKKKAAGTTNTSSGKNNTGVDVMKDMNSMSDEEFSKFLEKQIK